LEYINAKDVLPPGLLREIQKHLCGGLLYVPKAKKAAWGAANGTRADLRRRNGEILAAYRDGATIEGLMETYCLSESSIKKIIYT